MQEKTLDQVKPSLIENNNHSQENKNQKNIQHETLLKSSQKNEQESMNLKDNSLLQNSSKLQANSQINQDQSHLQANSLLNQNSNVQNNDSKMQSNSSIINQQENQIPSIVQAYEKNQQNYVESSLSKQKQQHQKVQKQGNSESIVNKPIQQNSYINQPSQLLNHSSMNSNLQTNQVKTQIQNTLKEKQEQQKIQQNIHQIFQKLDQNKDGKLTQQELQHVAKTLGISTITHQQIQQFMKEADIIKDNKITFQQFKIWYKRYSHVQSLPTMSKINKIIALKNQNLPKFIKLSSHKSQQEKILSQKKDKIQLNFQLGDKIQKEAKTKIKFNIHIGEKLYQNQVHQLKQKGIQLNEQKFGVVFQLKNDEPDKCKTMLQTLINEQKSKTTNSLVNTIDFQFKSTHHLTMIHITSKKLQEQFKDIIDFMKQKGTLQGQNYFFKAQTDFYIKKGVNDSIKEKFIHWFLNGFKCKIDIEGSSLFLKNLRKSFQSQFSSYLIIFSLIKQGKIDLKFRSIKSVETFLAKLGIKQLAEQTPLVQQILTELMGYYSDYFKEEQQLHFLKKLVDKSLQLSNQKICVSVFVGHLRIYLQIQADCLKKLQKMTKE